MSNRTVIVRSGDPFSLPIAEAQVIGDDTDGFEDDVVLVAPGAATLQGFGDAYSAGQNEIPMGAFILNRAQTGDVSAVPVPRVEMSDGNRFEQKRTVTGATLRTQVGTVVYKDSNGRWTITQPANVDALGMLFDRFTDDTFDILRLTVGELLTLALAGGSTKLMYLGHFDAADLANGDIRTAFPATAHGALIDVFAMIDIAPTGGGATVLINLEIGGTNVTGGVVTVATGDAKGAKKTGTAITADGGEIIHRGDVIDVEAASVSAFTTGSFDLFATVRHLPGV